MKAAQPFRLRHLVAVIASLAATAGVLAAMGRPWWCREGDLTPWSLDIWSPHNSQHLVDPYTVTHALHGIALYGILWATIGGVCSASTRAAIAMGIETAWEIVENTNWMIDRYRRATVSLGYYGDSILNSLGDIVAFLFGYFAAGVLPSWVSIAAFFAVDSLLVWWIRDSLLLNVLMLVHPLESVKAWQLGGMSGSH
jgi:Protein of unknown function (DUF2585)